MACEGVNVHGPIFITKYGGRIFDCMNPLIPGFFIKDKPRTTEIRNIRDVTIDVNAPLERFPIPETSCCQAIIVKAYGNHNTISIQWVIHEEDSNIVRQTLCTSARETCFRVGGVDKPVNMCCVAVGCVQTINNQLKWWGNVFQSNSIQDKFHIYVGDCFANMCANRIPFPTPATVAQEFNKCPCVTGTNQTCSHAYNKDGALQNFRAVLSGDTPVTYTAQATFYIGRTIAEPVQDKQ